MLWCLMSTAQEPRATRSIVERLRAPNVPPQGSFESDTLQIEWGESNSLTVGSQQAPIDERQVLQVSRSTTHYKPWWKRRPTTLHWLHVELRNSLDSTQPTFTLSAKLPDKDLLTELPMKDCTGHELPANVLLDAAESWLASGARLAHLPAEGAGETPYSDVAPYTSRDSKSDPVMFIPESPARTLKHSPRATRVSSTLHPGIIGALLVQGCGTTAGTLLALSQWSDVLWYLWWLVPLIMVCFGLPLLLLQKHITRAQLGSGELGVPFGCGRKEEKVALELSFSAVSQPAGTGVGFALVSLVFCALTIAGIESEWPVIIHWVIAFFALEAGMLSLLQFSTNTLILGEKVLIWRRKAFGLTLERSCKRDSITAVNLAITESPSNPMAKVTLTGPELCVMRNFPKSTAVWLSDELIRWASVSVEVSRWAPEQYDD